jgi:spermidine synthase
VANSSEYDESIYHENLVHPASLAHPDPKSFCIIGGAEGATAREALRHPTTKRVVMVDIDRELVDLCRLHLPNWSAGAFQDPRFELICGDGRKYLAETAEKFDVILVDLTDPVENSPAVFLYTREHYQIIYDHLTDDGTVCLQAESWNPWRMEIHARMYNTLATIFPHVNAYGYFLPCFHEPHSMIIASRGRNPKEMDLGARLMESGLTLEYFTPDNLGALFSVPRYVEKAYRQYTDILTDARALTIMGM